MQSRHEQGDRMEHVVLPGAGVNAVSSEERGEKGIGPDRRFCSIVTCDGPIANGRARRLAEHPQGDIEPTRKTAQGLHCRVRLLAGLASLTLTDPGLRNA
jgi:hypothetical protein